MTKANQFKALAVVAAMTLALCLLAWVAVQPAQAAFPGENGEIAFQSDRDGPVEIYATSPGGTPERNTTSNNSSDPAYSPDGSKIAFVNSENNISVMNADGTRRMQLPDTGSPDLEPAWSPDGKRITFVSNTFRLNRQTDYEIWVMNVDGSGQRPITANTYPDINPAWSPDGSKIAFVSSRPGDNARNVYVMDANGDDQTDLTQDHLYDTNLWYQGHDDHPAWSPDGSEIAYVHTFAPNASGKPNIWTMTAAGSGKVNLQADNSVSGFWPAWSPDGSNIAYQGIPSDNNPNIYVMDANLGGSGTAIDTDPADDDKPDWQPITLRIGDARVKENNTSARFTVSLSGASQQPVTVTYATANGTAKAPADYTAETGTLTFAPGETSMTVTVAVRSDRRDERNEAFFVDLSNASTTVADAGGKGTIVDND
jgi:Tol biopolymer transport system component